MRTGLVREHPYPERERRWRTAVEDPAAGSRPLLASAAALVAAMELGEGRLGIKP